MAEIRLRAQFASALQSVLHNGKMGDVRLRARTSLSQNDISVRIAVDFDGDEYGVRHLA